MVIRMSDVPLISVIVPVYKIAEEYLKECVDSILAQTLKDIEIILVDDGSPDNCGIICDEYASKDSRIKVVHKKNGGLSSARNAGMDAASAEYVQFVDADDYIDKMMCQTLFETIRKYQTDVVICGYVRLFKNSVETPVSASKAVCGSLLQLERIFTEILNNAVFNTVCNKLYRRELCPEFDTEVRFGEDTIYNINYLSANQSAVVISETLYYYRYADVSMCNIYRENAIDEELFLIHKILDFCDKNFSQEFNKNELYYIFCMYLRAAFYRAARGKNVTKKVKKDMERKDVAEILNYPGIKLCNFYDKLYVFLMKHKMARSFVFCARAEAFLIRLSPGIVNFARRLFNKKN